MTLRILTNLLLSRCQSVLFFVVSSLISRFHSDILVLSANFRDSKVATIQLCFLTGTGNSSKLIALCSDLVLPGFSLPLVSSDFILTSCELEGLCQLHELNISLLSMGKRSPALCLCCKVQLWEKLWMNCGRCYAITSTCMIISHVIFCHGALAIYSLNDWK